MSLHPPSHILKHVAIIMDGNGRWAKARMRPRVWGHIRGARVVSGLVQAAVDLDIEQLTLYAFSTENWGRPLGEVKVLFKLLKKFLINERAKIFANDIRFEVIGEYRELPEATIQLIDDLCAETKNHKGLKLIFAFGYGARAEIVRAANRFISLNPGRELSENDLASHLYSPDSREVDLLIRTGGDCRISNFLLWQLAYAELYFTPTKWPDFTSEEFREIIYSVCGRERRFGSVDFLASSVESAKTQAQLNRHNYVQQ